MKHRLLITIVIILLLSAAIWFFVSQGLKKQSSSSADGSTSENKTAFQVITATQAKEMIDKGGVIIVDVRRQDEYEAGHISDAILIPNETIGTDAIAQLPDKEAVILVYCRTGIRARDAAQKLADLGYKNVYDFGGIADWPYDIVK